MQSTKMVEAEEKWGENLIYDWVSHIPGLSMALSITDGDVLELGTGIGSSCVIRAMLLNRDRKVLSVETDERWASLFTRSFMEVFPKSEPIVLVKDIIEYIKTLNRHFGVCLVDFDGLDGDFSKRKEAVKILKDKVDILVLHDSNDKQFLEDEDFVSFMDYFDFSFELSFGNSYTCLFSRVVDLEREIIGRLDY